MGESVPNGDGLNVTMPSSADALYTTRRLDQQALVLAFVLGVPAGITALLVGARRAGLGSSVQWRSSRWRPQ
jgi:hypothetical protein